MPWSQYRTIKPYKTEKRGSHHELVGSAGSLALLERIGVDGVLRESQVGKEKIFIRPKLIRLLIRDDNAIALYA
jgi:hypothetical protein